MEIWVEQFQQVTQ